MNLRRVCLLVIFSFYVISCRTHDAASDAKKIIGDNDLTPVSIDGYNVPLPYQKYLNAIGYIVPNGCTVTHIGNGFALTAGHCFVDYEVSLQHQPCNGFKVRWARRGDPTYLGESRCKEIAVLHQSKDGWDYALIKLSSAPKEFIPLDLNRKPLSGSRITIFSQPKGRPLEWSQYCALDEGNSQWKIAHPGRFKHSCDTETGSSGAVVIDDVTYKIIGIHSGGNSSFNSATYAKELSLGNFENLLTAVTSEKISEPDIVPPEVETKVDKFQYGPFENNLDKLLYTMPTTSGKFASFTVWVDLESWKDYLIVTDGDGNSRKFSAISGDTVDLKTPVTFRIQTDEKVESKEVALTDISYHD